MQPEKPPHRTPPTDLPPVSLETTWRPGGNESNPKKGSSKNKIWMIVGGVLAGILIAVLAGVGWYRGALEPMADSAETQSIPVVIELGSTPDVIGSQLEEAGVIRSSTAFLIYTRLEGVRGSLQAGSYRFSPAKSVPEIVNQLTGGQVGEFTVTFYPGSSLYINAYDSDQTPSHREVLESLGYSRSEIEAAFEADYDHPLFADRPSGATVEGYIYGETYQFAEGASIEDILIRTFDEMYKVLTDSELLQAYERRDMTLHEAVTLASIIEREVHDEADQRQVAQVFYKRLNDGMPLGADATFVYAARMDGQTPTVDYDSPYNTRIHGGLPPGPIASPGVSALKAVANPASGDYLYFVSGDDGTNYFSRTLEEHERKTARYCHANCSLF